MRTVDCPDRPFAVLVDDDGEAPDEHVLIVMVERNPEVALVVPELVDVLRALEPAEVPGDPGFPDVEDRPRGISTGWEEAAEIERSSTITRGFDDEITIWVVRRGAVAVEKLGDVREVIPEAGVGESQPRLRGLQIFDVLVGGDRTQLGDLATDHAAPDRLAAACVELECRDRNADNPPRDTNGGQFAALHQP